MNDVTLLDDGTALIHLYGGEKAIVDQDDLELVAERRWYAYRAKAPRIYVSSGVTGLWLHRVLLQAPEGMTVDHINHDGLDNRRSNLRLATNAQNLANRRPWGKSGVKGAYYDKTKRRWEVRVMADGERLRLGRYKTKEEAGLAYDRFAYSRYGKHAFLNYPELLHSGGSVEDGSRPADPNLM